MSALSNRWGWLLGIAFAFSGNCALAQITSDGTLPNNSDVRLQGNTFNITGGTQAGSNLFHSFGQFSVPTGGTAFFNNAVGIQNIISRVTGGSVSNIDGLIRANGTANLFLINPSGIVFGQNASLNVGGSFVASTANAIQFGNLGFFSATNPNNPALLTINPSALFFNQIAAAPIQNNSAAPAGLDQSGFNAFGLRVPDGQSLLLVGGDISMDGGRLNAFGGRVELGGLAAAGTVGLNVDDSNLSLSFPENVARADVSLINAASVDVIAENRGSITINARNIDILGRSRLLGGIGSGLGTPESQAGDITLNAIGTIRAGQAGRILNIVDSNAIGNAGNINVTADSLSLTDGTQLAASAFGRGNAGNVKIQVRDNILFDGIDNNGFSSGVFSSVEQGASGKGGNINITTGSLALKNGARLNTSTFGQGDTGSITVKATDTISLDGVGSNGSLSGIFNNVSPGAVGEGGNISLTTESLSASNGAQIIASTFGQGNAGNINVKADTISLDGIGNNASSGVFSSVEQGASGKGGNINITTESLALKNGARLNTSTVRRK
ncbi:MAG: filamentous hemagglutinin N-terminal domain-containing protein [Spirirestis rafaelensis WJT71-NPBG6]|jgi:filamentous hemagglutinin family protein|nr:filamentous hemagglutinin N-terminal domain-containing protein [Spirirestis rafaelensis WJT71-NPBG6]